MGIELARAITTGCIWIAAAISCKWLGGLGLFAFLFAAFGTIMIWGRW